MPSSWHRFLFKVVFLILQSSINLESKITFEEKNLPKLHNLLLPIWKFRIKQSLILPKFIILQGEGFVKNPLYCFSLVHKQQFLVMQRMQCASYVEKRSQVLWSTMLLGLLHAFFNLLYDLWYYTHGRGKAQKKLQI